MPKINEVIKLTAKSHKGKSKLEAFGTEWKVRLVSRFRAEPAVLLECVDRENTRWVNLTDDPDFEINKIDENPSECPVCEGVHDG